MHPNKRKANRIVTLSVTNDILTDQRLHKVATSLMEIGLDPCIVGVKFRKSLDIEKRLYKTKRLILLFKKGPLFYAEFNFRLFFHLLFSKSDILIANDLDTLLANYLAYKIKHVFVRRTKLVYDSHELFTELPELNGRQRTKSIWLSIEEKIMPKLKNTYTVCEPIAEYYNKKYNINMLVIRNMPICIQQESAFASTTLELPENKKVILYQGALNIGRGIEQVIELMEFIDNAIFVIAGSGSKDKSLKEMVTTLGLEKKVIFTGKLPFEELNQLTRKADLGLVLQEDISLSYHYALPNRLFDFIKAGVPIIASAQPEIVKIVEKEQIGLIVKELNDKSLLEKIKTLLTDNSIIDQMKENIKNCAWKYCWEIEEEKLLKLYQNLR